jgi:hypothetical protein
MEENSNNNARRTASIFTATETFLLRIDKNSFKSFYIKLITDKHEEIMKLLMTLSFF